jgi:hypothetical protein
MTAALLITAYLIVGFVVVALIYESPDGEFEIEDLIGCICAIAWWPVVVVVVGLALMAFKAAQAIRRLRP